MFRETKRAALAAGILLVSCTAHAQQEEEKPSENWSNETELSFVVTDGNSNTETLGLKNLLTRQWEGSEFRLKLEALRTNTSDDWYEQVVPGVTWLPGAPPPTDSETNLVKPPSEPDVENYFLEGRYDRQIRKELNWHAGGSWDRNKDAGILSRYIAFGGVGNLWRDEEALRLQTSYGLSWTSREEETPDPEKEDRFLGARLGLSFLVGFWKTTTYTNDTTFNLSLVDTQDWTVDMTNALSVSMNKWLSLRVSLRWLYNNEPALEDVDVLARVEIRDPDGIPGSGDEYFETVSSGGSEVVFGETRVRKEKLDQILKTTLVISF